MTQFACEACDADDSVSISIVSRAVEELAAAWRRGERVSVEDLLARLPKLADEDAVRLIFEEACLRRDFGDSSVTASVLERFPQYRDELAMLLECDRLMRGAPAAVFPEVGSDLDDFRIESELGRGALGRTYLATQRSLGGRSLVLKITPLGQEEHMSLARLRHMHIIPLYFEQVLPERSLRVLGMPYLGGKSLAALLETMRETPASARSGRRILEGLDEIAAARAGETPIDGPFRSFLARASYTQAICWIGACLADALQYAHDCGLVHFDVKPANVLLAADCRPMLLDFHLASGPIGRGLPVPDRLGGTPGYLSPEQRAVMESLDRGTPVTAVVDGRSDLYSLGVLLYEALGGAAMPERPTSRRSLVRSNPEVSPGLSDIVSKCLKESAEDRYANAGALARDLRRHLNDQELLGVDNRSLAERWRKWRRRRPGVLAWGLLRVTAVAVFLTATAWGISQYRQWTREVEGIISESRRELRAHRYDEAEGVLRRGIALARLLPGDDWRKKELRRRLRRVFTERAAGELHSLVKLLRFQNGFPARDPAALHGLLQRAERIWGSRDLFNPHENEPPRPELQRQIRIDFLELAAVWAEVATHSGPGPDRKAGLREAVRILEEARTQFGNGPALTRDLEKYIRALAGTNRPPTAPPTPHSAWEHYDLGRSYLRSGNHRLAEDEFRRSVELEPGEFWPYFFWGVCAFHGGHFQDAVTALSASVALSPQPECYYNRAQAYQALGASDRAYSDYSRALEIMPNFANAALNRGILAYRNGRLADAKADIEHAREAVVDEPTLGLIEYNLALVHLSRGDFNAAKSCLHHAGSHGNLDAMLLMHRLQLDPAAEPVFKLGSR